MFGWILVCVAGDSISLSEVTGDFAKWKLQGASVLGCSNGTMQMLFSHKQPMLFTAPCEIDADQVKSLTFTLKLPAGKERVGNILFITADNKVWSDQMMARFTCQTDGEAHTYKVDISACPLWKGKVVQLRFTPAYLGDFDSLGYSERHFEFGENFTSTLPPYQWKLSEYGLEETGNACALPAPYAAADWRVVAYNNHLRDRNMQAEFVFLGDSLTQLWLDHPQYPNGGKVWQQEIVPLKAQNLGISGDRTQHTLWQITEGKIVDGMKPKAFIVMCGINNVLDNNDPREIADGMKSIITVLKQKSPDAKILLLGLLPTNLTPDSATNAAKVNAYLKRLAVNAQITYLDMGPQFLDAKGVFNSELTYDKIHLNEKGYAVWARTMIPVLKEMVKE